MQNEFSSNKNEKNKNSNSNYKEQNILNNDNINNSNNKSNESSDFEKEEDDQPFFIMTLEFEKGKYKKIKIYPDSDPTELAFNFCKVNNFDFTTMKYINSEIQNLLSKFKSNSNLEEFTNNSIQEVEEENAMTDKTINSIERSKEELLKNDIIDKKNKNDLIENEKKISSQDFKNSNKKNIDNNDNNYNINKIKKNENNEIQNLNKEKENDLKIKNNNNTNNIIKEENNEEKLNNNQSISLSNNNTMKIENAYITNSVRTNKDPKTSADSNLISNTSSCDSPKGKNDRLPSLEEIKELSQDKILFKEKFLEPINNISIAQRSVNNNNFNFDKLSKISQNNNKCYTEESNNNSIINNNNNFNNSRNNNILINFTQSISSTNSNKLEINYDNLNQNLNFKNQNFINSVISENQKNIKIPFDVINNNNQKTMIFSHPDINELLELKKKKDEQLRALEEEKLKKLNEKQDLEEEKRILEEEDKKEREEYLLYERNEKTKKLINDFTNEKIDNNYIEQSKTTRTHIYTPKKDNKIINNNNLIIDDIDMDLSHKFLSQKIEKIKKNINNNSKELKSSISSIKKDKNDISNVFNIVSNKTGRNFDYNNNNILVEKSVDIFLSGKDIFKTHKDDNLYYNLSSNLDLSVTNRNLTNANTTNNNIQLQDISQFSKQINHISTNKKNYHKHIPLPTSPSHLKNKFKNNKLFQYEILDNKKDYEISFSKSREYSNIKSYTYGNINFTQRSSEKKSNRSLSRGSNHSKSKSISENIFNKLYHEAEINKQLPKRPCHFSYRMDNLGFTFDGKNYFSDDEKSKKIQNLKGNFNRKNNQINNILNLNHHHIKVFSDTDKGKKMNYGEYLYKRGVEERDLRNEKLEKIRSKLEKNDKDKCLFKPKINKNFRPIRNKSMFEISEIKINETHDYTNELKENKNLKRKKKKQKNINLLNKNNEFQNPYILKKLDKLKKDFEQKYTFKPKINDNYIFSPGLNFFKRQEIYNEYTKRNDVTKIESKRFNKNNSLSRIKKYDLKKKNSFNTCCSALMLRNKPYN